MPIVKHSAAQIRKSGGRINRARVARTSDRALAVQAAADADTAPVQRVPRRAWRRVYNPPVPDVRALRHRLDLSQSEFAARFGFSVRTVQQWEQGRAVPDRSARILLRVIEKMPKAVENAMA
jgi:putative transcriptional regulator